MMPYLLPTLSPEVAALVAEVKRRTEELEPRKQRCEAARKTLDEELGAYDAEVKAIRELRSAVYRKWHAENLPEPPKDIHDGRGY